MIISGDVEKVIFRNPDNGYTVVDLKCSGDYVTAVGIFPELYDGVRVELTGDYKYHSRHGIQFLAEGVKVLEPEGLDAVEKFLKSGIFRGIGEVTAKNIVEKFKETTLDVMRNSPEKLATVKGIGARRAEEICESFRAHGEMQDAILFLQKFDISLNLALKIYKAYGARTEEVIKSNPYQLISDVERVGFQTADKIAFEAGIAKDSDFRIRAGIIYTLKDAAQKSGHTALPDNILKKDVLSLLGFDESFSERIDDNIEDLIFLSEIKDYVSDNARFYMLYKNYLTERNIARRLVFLEEAHKSVETDFTPQIYKFEEISGVVLHDKQRKAVNDSINSGVHVITGGPGTGKTTIIKCILHVLKFLKLSYCLCAPTGRAAKRMSEATGEDAKTIHRLLDLDFKDGKGFFTFNENTKIPADVVIVDEVSMVDEYVFSSLLKAIRDGASVILVGDKDQLASVGAGNVLSDIITSGFFKVTYLDKIYRQSDGSMIIENAHLINHGKMPVLDNRSDDFFFVDKKEPSDISEEVKDLVTKRLPKYLGCKETDVQVLCPMKKGVAGVINLNAVIRDRLNPKKDADDDVKCGEYTFRAGDKVMQTVNNYEQEWYEEIDGRIHHGRGVFNGDTGFIESIDRQNMKFNLRFDDGKVADYSLGDIDQIIPAYAVSVHKSQGSEFRAVVVALSQGNYFIMTRNLLYTAVTRARDLVVIVGDRDTLSRMVRNNYTAKRYTLLTEFISEAGIENE